MIEGLHPHAPGHPPAVRLLPHQRHCRVLRAALPLTRREYRLLSHLLRGAARIHARDALLAAAWGDDSESTDRTVDTHIKTLRAKLREVDAGREYISTHRGMGYCLDV